ncbi:MAG: efflux RND transporter permease subunit, partial [Pseudomonadota bacterium]
LIERFARHPVAANLTMLAMIMAGIWATRVMPTQLDPPAHLPWIIIEVTWDGAGAEDIEALVTRPIEAQLRTLKDLRSHNSRSVDGYMRLVLQLDFDADVAESLDTVKQRVASLRNLPAGIETPIIRRALDYEPIARLIVTGPGTLAELVPEARAMEQSLLDAGIEAIYLSGLPAEEIALQVRSEQLAALKLTLSDLAAKVAAESRNAPGGALGNGSGATQLRSLADRRDPLDYDALLISHGGQLLRLGDIAEVVRRSRPGEPQITSDGRAAIELRLLRNTATDAYRSEQALRDWLAETRPQLPAGIDINVSQNVWQLLGAQLDMILSNGLSGLLLVIGVLYLFLNVRAAWWVMLGIPVSFMLALALFHLGFGYGISIIALIGLIMALGIVVDDAIVVGEDIVALTEQGMAPQEAAVLGAQRMFAPVVTSSLTTLAAFLPLLIIGGVMGDVILALPTLLLCVILASLFECFLVLPGHLGHRLSPLGHSDEGFGEGPGEHRSNRLPAAAAGWRSRFNRAFADFRDQRFLSWVDWALAHPGVTLTAAGSSLLVAIMLLVSQHVGFNLVTSMDIDSLKADVAFSASATATERRQFLEQLEATLNETDATYDNRNLQGYSTRIALARFEDDDETGEQFASVRADYAYAETRTLSPDEFAAAWRERVVVPPFVERLRIRAGGGAGGDQPDLSLILRGQQFEALRSAAGELTAELQRYPGVSNVLDNLPPAREQIVFTLLPTGEQLGLSTQGVAAQLRDAYSGTLIQIFNEHNAELEVRMLLPETERRDLSRLGQFPISLSSDGVVPLASIATLTRRTGTDLIRHSDGELAVTVSADVDPETSNAIQVLNEVTDNVLPSLLQRYELDYGLGGKSRDDALLLETMQLGGLLTLVLIYLILAWAFASYLWPLAIMLAIPFGFTGAVVGHWIMNWDIGAMSLLAFFSLTGIVVNDSIVLISFLRRELAAGVALETALRDAVRARFRAVLLTSLTTIAGLLPLLFTSSSLSMYVTPIAITLCFGLAFATLLVLIVIPALLLLLERGKARAGRRMAGVLAMARAALPTPNSTVTTEPDNRSA